MVDRYSPGTRGEWGGLNDRFITFLLCPLMLAIENRTIDPTVRITKINNSLVRHADFVVTKWVSCSFCVNEIQFNLIHPSLNNICCNQNRLLVIFEVVRTHCQRSGTKYKRTQRENKVVPVNATKWAPLQSISHKANAAVTHDRCKWAVLRCLSGPVFQQHLQMLLMPPWMQEPWLAYFTFFIQFSYDFIKLYYFLSHPTVLPLGAISMHVVI